MSDFESEGLSLHMQPSLVITDPLTVCDMTPDAENAVMGKEKTMPLLNFWFNRGEREQQMYLLIGNMRVLPMSIRQHHEKN